MALLQCVLSPLLVQLFVFTVKFFINRLFSDGWNPLKIMNENKYVESVTIKNELFKRMKLFLWVNTLFNLVLNHVNLLGY